MDRTKALYMNTTALAFMGDAVYETWVRKLLLERGEIHADSLHREAVKYVRASAQATVIKGIFDDLSEEEQGLVKRARNRKSASRPRSAHPVEYKWATAFEALVGYLYLTEQEERLQEILDQSAVFVEN